ncbi:MAG: hypothetical protein JO225_09060 [Candidatus Eremiobacteraeota bacterium]|nr:hypothetical protein [Candidatus Eremiobacteraeota bacterium]
MLASLLAAAVAAAPLLAASPLDTDHAAVLYALQNDVGGGCPPDVTRKAAQDASIRSLGHVGDDEVVLASVESPCICGAQNCPYYVIRLTAGNPRVLLSTFGISARTRAESPLPRIVVDAHDSALVVDETTYAYRDGKYVGVDSVRVRASDNARKPQEVPVRFAAGASSARLSGSIANGWFDTYTFAAGKGQKVQVDGVSSKAHLTLTLFGGPDVITSRPLTPGVPFTLPKSTTYRLMVDCDADHDTPYALTFAIR